MEFIHRVPNLVSKQFCEDIIEQFEKSKLTGPGHTYVFEDGEIIKSSDSNSKVSTDISVYPGFIEAAEEKGEPEWREFVNYINSKLQIAINEYVEKFPMMHELQRFVLEGYNIQRYLPGEGFYTWHCENSGYKGGGDRVLAWMIYLNDVTDRGETEFYYQHHFERPEEGKLVIWPSDWTHLHRGITSPTQTKYILTGWFNHLERPETY